LSFNVAVKNTVPLTINAKVSVSANPPSPPPSASITAPASATAGSTVTLVGVVSNGAAFKWTQTAGPVVTLSAGNTLSPSIVAPKGPASVTFALTATTAAGASATASRTIAVAVDTVAIAPVTWDNRQGKGKLNLVATSTAITGATAPAGMSMTATLSNRNIAAGLPGSAANPIVAPMSVVKDLPGQPPVCGSALPCFFAPLVSVMVNPSSSSAVPVFVAPTTIVVKSSLGGSATVTGAAITVK
jgi:hypothetical protein